MGYFFLVVLHCDSCEAFVGNVNFLREEATAPFCLAVGPRVWHSPEWTSLHGPLSPEIFDEKRKALWIFFGVGASCYSQGAFGVQYVPLRVLTSRTMCLSRAYLVPISEPWENPTLTYINTGATYDRNSVVYCISSTVRGARCCVPVELSVFVLL